MVRVAFKGAKGASVAGCPCVRVPVHVCGCICAGVACMRDGVRADGAGGAGNARAGRARVQGVPVSVRVLVWVLVFSVSVFEVEESFILCVFFCGQCTFVVIALFTGKVYL